MTLDPLAIAAQGLGFDELLVALQGLQPIDAQAEQTPPDPFATFRPRRRVRRVYPAPTHDISEDEDELAALRMLGLH